jgi:hypothetical protein
MADSEQFPTKNRELIAISAIMIFLSSLFTVWRVIVRCKVSPWMAWSDWFMIVGAVRTIERSINITTNIRKQIVSISGMALSIACGMKGAGRLLGDPFWQPNAVDKMILQNHLTFAAQLCNIYGIFVVKLSICAYLLALNFSKTYRWVVWVS